MMLALSGADYSTYFLAAIESLHISMPSIFGTEFAFTTNIVYFRINWILCSVRLGNRTYRGGCSSFGTEFALTTNKNNSEELS